MPRYLFLTLLILFPLLLYGVAPGNDSMLRLNSVTPDESNVSWRLNGYMREIAGIRTGSSYGDVKFDNLLHNRLNMRVTAGKSFTFIAEGRNRLFYNSLFREFPFMADLLGDDPGLVDMSWVWYSGETWIGHSMIDRLYADFTFEKLQIRAGRQRINWGITMVSNPNDLFNTYSFFDFDYPERPGADALRVRYHTGFASRIEIAWAPGRESKESTAALLWATNIRGYDFQAIAGYYHHRAALGGGWAGNIGGAGFKGEATWFYDLERGGEDRRGNLVAATGIDYMFDNGTFAVAELLYNGGYRNAGGESILLSSPLRADNIMFSEYAVTVSANHPISTLLQGGASVMLLPDIKALFFMPSVKWSIITNLDMELFAQLFAGGKETIFSEAGSYWAGSLKYSF